MELKKVKSKIRSALKKQNTYTPEMESAIDLCAGSYMAFLKAVADIENLESVTITEKTREGNDKVMPHPAFGILTKTGETTRKALRELELTLASIGGASDDEVSDLVDEVEGIKNA